MRPVVRGGFGRVVFIRRAAGRPDQFIRIGQWRIDAGQLLGIELVREAFDRIQPRLAVASDRRAALYIEGQQFGQVDQP